jgi:hypothetical protein
VATRQLSSFINSPSFINNSSLSSTLLSPLTVARAAYWLLSGGYREVVESSGWVEQTGTHHRSRHRVRTRTQDLESKRFCISTASIKIFCIRPPSHLICIADH